MVVNKIRAVEGIVKFFVNSDCGGWIMWKELTKKGLSKSIAHLDKTYTKEMVIKWK